MEMSLEYHMNQVSVVPPFGAEIVQNAYQRTLMLHRNGNLDGGESDTIGNREVSYDYSAEWSWNANDGPSSSLTNNVTGDTGRTINSSWDRNGDYYYTYGGCYDYSCSYSDSGCTSSSPVDLDYDTTVSNTGWGGGQVAVPSGVRWSPFSGSVSQGENSYSGCGCYGCCGYTYEWHNAYFNAPNFSVSMTDETYDYGYGEYRYENNDVWHPGRSNYYYYYYYNDYVFSHSMLGSRVPGGDIPGTPFNGSGTIGTAAIIVAQPNFGNVAFIDMDALLDEQCTVPESAPFIPLDINNIPGISENTFWNSYWESWGDSSLANRVAGLAQSIGGVAEIAVGIFATPTPAAPIGVALIVHGGDNVATGIIQTFTGEHQRTFTSKGVGLAVEKATGSVTAGLIVGEGVDLSVSVVGPGLASKMMGGQGLFGSIKSVAGDAWSGIKNAGTNVKNWWKGTPTKATLANPGNRETLDKLLRNQGYEIYRETKGGYVHYRHPDGREVFIRPNGEVGFLGSEITAATGKKYHPRTDAYGNRIDIHNTGIFVEPIK